ncbi:MAG: DUF721 domain-containing protein [Paracoccaceae bacterium]
MQSHIRKLGESRGFAQPRVLTHWREIVGEDLADVTYPTEVSYAKQGFGGTLTILTMGAHAPMIEMQKESLRRRVNAVYGYNAIRRIRITQTSAHGFAEAQAVFAPQSKPAPQRAHKAAEEQAQTLAEPVRDANLRRALEQLGQNVLTQSQEKK